ncbi:type I DNA topoisomerase [bacterium]|nr:type I DNA topoisomerase [bacterium]
MGKFLVVVESPAKSKTIGKYLGNDFKIKASMGHIMDLPKNKVGVDTQDGFKPEYVVIDGKQKILKELKALARQSEKIYLAPDPDREGEAICWHLSNELSRDNKNIYRVSFNEITKNVVREAIAHPSSIDLNKVNAQQTRRILDRIVGYKISPLLSKKVRRGLSAGRVQSVALRLICDREKEIEAFVVEEYWSVTAKLAGSTNEEFEAKLEKRDSKKVKIENEAEAKEILSYLDGKKFIVGKIARRERKKSPAPPFITSTLQQEASSKLRFSAKQTMQIAQQLYEGQEAGEDSEVGLITYMRTDSVKVAAEAQAEARDYIDKFLHDSLPARPPQYKSKKSAQEAHEAIRPTSCHRTPESLKAYLTSSQYKLYKIICERFLASQMEKALIDVTEVEIQAGDCLFKVKGEVIKFAGFMKIYQEESQKENLLPLLKETEELRLIKLEPGQHFTQPKPRYTEATLVKALEEKGIGRPSTYAPTISVIEAREYVDKKERKFYPTELGMMVTELLVENFPKVLDISFTASMEEELDRIENGKSDWIKTLSNFYGPFEQALEAASKNMRDIKKEQQVITDEVCELCGEKMMVRVGRTGKFLGCSGFPKCKNTKPLEEGEGIKVKEEKETKEICPECKKPLIIREGRFGEFFSCSGYPKCKYSRSMGTGIACPTEGCQGELVKKRSKRGRVFYSCNKYPACKFAVWDEPTKKKCPDCGSILVKKKDSLACSAKGCGFKQDEAA